jgi:hypothetical protein
VLRAKVSSLAFKAASILVVMIAVSAGPMSHSSLSDAYVYKSISCSVNHGVGVDQRDEIQASHDFQQAAAWLPMI